MEWVFIIGGFCVFALFVAFMAEREHRNSNVTKPTVKPAKSNDDGIGWVEAGVIDSIID